MTGYMPYEARIREALLGLMRRVIVPAAVYRICDRDGNPVYIGSSYDPAGRLRRHQQAAWFPPEAIYTEDWYPDRALAFEMELEAIRAELPAVNVAGKPKTTPQPARVETVTRGTAGGSA